MDKHEGLAGTQLFLKSPCVCDGTERCSVLEGTGLSASRLAVRCMGSLEVGLSPHSLRPAATCESPALAAEMQHASRTQSQLASCCLHSTARLQGRAVSVLSQGITEHSWQPQPVSVLNTRHTWVSGGRSTHLAVGRCLPDAAACKLPQDSRAGSAPSGAHS